MGASSSSSSIHPSTLLSARENKVEESPCMKDTHTNDSGGQRTCTRATSTYNVKYEPPSQNPSPYQTLSSDEFWDQRPAVSTLSSMLPPKRETTLTYATQMTGWQEIEDHRGQPLYRQNNNEVVELLRIVSQLAMANHQLASAQNVSSARTDALHCPEVPREREDRKRTISTEGLETFDDVLKQRLQYAGQGDTEMEEIRKLEQRVLKLESLLVQNNIDRQYKQTTIQEDNKLHSRTERLENPLRIQETKNDNCSESYYEPPIEPLYNEEGCSLMERRTNHVVTDAVSKISEDNGERRDGMRKVTGDRRDCRVCSDRTEINAQRFNENASSASIDLDRIRETRAKSRDDVGNSTKVPAVEETLGLSGEIKDLRTTLLDCQSTKKELLRTVTERESLAEELNEEELKSRHLTVETSLYERGRQYNEMTKDLASAKKEITRLLKQIDIYQSEKETADARISILEQNLQKSLFEKEQIKNTENQKISKLRAQLSEEVADKKKQIKALEDAMQEIQRLKGTIKTDNRGNDSDVTAKEDIDTIDSIEDVVSGSTSDRTVANIEEFKKELTLKREARQRGIAAIASEIERLKRELDAEKEAHSETSAMLALLRSTCNNSRNQHITNVHDSDANHDVGMSITYVKEEQSKSSNEDEKALRRAEARRLTNTLKVSDELRNGVRYQIEKMDDLRYHLETDPERHQVRIRSLTEITNKTRESLVARERLTNELKDYLAQVLVRLGDRSFLQVRDDAATECDRQLENINALKVLYNERLRVLTELRDSAIKELVDVKQKLEHSVKMSENLQEELRKAEEKVDVQDSEITNLESQLGLTKADCRDLQNQMSLINGLFTQMLLGASSADMDLDRLTQLLQENHDLISDIAREESTEAAALPKLLLDLIEQVEGGKASQKHTDEKNGMENLSETDRKEDDLLEKDIAHNLPKVWRVLLELLSCHAVNSPSVSVASCSDPNTCYKSVDTPTGPTLVISVSKTYIRLKELILEKKHLEKEMNRMKQLNSHLESKLGEQEKRLSMVSAELTKTWNIVGRMRAQHEQLHTHEQILRYELQQKRKMLQELKQELEYCKEKWESARQKNTNTELEWRSLRREFAARKALAAHDSFNNSAESGFSDERGDDTDDEEDEAIEERIRHGPRRRTRKENPRAPTPDTESELPTDTELSESKTGSSVTLEQRTPTPETEAELDDKEIADIDSECVKPEIRHAAENTQETLNPLDQALTNVIQNLIRIDNGESDNDDPTLRRNIEMGDSSDNLPSANNDNGNNHLAISKKNFCDAIPRPWTPTSELWYSSATTGTLKRTPTSIDLSSAIDNNDESIESSSIIPENSSRPVDKDDQIKPEIVPPSISHVPVLTTADTTSTISVFSIGPCPTTSVTTSTSIKSVQFSDPLIVEPSNSFSPAIFGDPTTESSEDYKGNSTASVIRSPSTSSANQERRSTEGKETPSSKSIENIMDSDSLSIDSSSSLDTIKELCAIEFNSPSTSTSEEELGELAISSQMEATVDSTKCRTAEEVLAARAERLKRLEEQADWLVKKMNATSKRGSDLCTRLEELHETYGEPPPPPPPMPDVLPSHRLPSSLPYLPPQVLASSSAGDIENAEVGSSSPTKDDASPSDNTP